MTLYRYPPSDQTSSVRASGAAKMNNGLVMRHHSDRVAGNSQVMMRSKP